MSASAADFYAKDLGITQDAAKKIAWAMGLNLKAISKRCVWAKHGKVRCYFELWSQNNLYAARSLDGCYYDYDENDVFVTGYCYRNYLKYPLSTVATWKSGSFSGAKTRAAIKEFAEVFYEQKATWG